MSQNQQTRLILRPINFWRRWTPLTTDCGELCGHRCCHGEDHDGMWLLPGEEQFFLGQPGFSVQPCQDNAGYPLVVCDGHCDRRLRPFACRIFPLFPMVRLSPLGGIMVQAQMDREHSYPVRCGSGSNCGCSFAAGYSGRVRYWFQTPSCAPIFWRPPNFGGSGCAAGKDAGAIKRFYVQAEHFVPRLPASCRRKG